MIVSVNGEQLQLEAEASLLMVLEKKDWHQKNGIAVAINEHVVPRAEWSTTHLKNNDTILVITATQGG